jgi:multimeric flavodoxin WrbA
MRIKILGISGSPRKEGNTEILVREALLGAGEIAGVEPVFLGLAGKKIGHCTGCLACEKRKRFCVIKDDFREFFKGYMEADGIILGSPVYHLAITSTLKAAIDRLGQSMFAIYRGKLPRLCKVGGAIAQGGSLYGGQEYALQFMASHFILQNCLFVSGDRPQSKMGVPASTLGDSTRGSIGKNEGALRMSRTLGRRVAEMAKIVQAGLAQMGGELGPEYRERKHLESIYREEEKDGGEKENGKI